MPESHQHSDPVHAYHFVAGTPVFGARGTRVGTVNRFDLEGQYLIVHKTWLYPQEYYMPLVAIDRADADGVHLTLAEGDVMNQAWNAPPTST